MSTDFQDSRSTSTSGHKPGGISGIRRNRPSYSCEGCRARRVKCDLGRPQCGSCARNGLSCAYPNSTIKRTSSNDNTIKRPACNKGSKRKSAFGGSPPDVETPNYSNLPQAQSFWATLDSKSHDVKSLLGATSNTLVRLCNADLESMGSGPSLHAMTTETHPFLSVYERMTTETGHDQFRLARLLEKLPDRSTCDYLYAMFVCCVHPITPYFHHPTFDGRYRRFWRWYERWDRMSPPQGILADMPSFLPLLIAVFYYGSVIKPLVTTSPWPSEQSIDPALFLALGMQALGMVEFPNKTSLSSLVAFILLQMDQLRCQDASACSFVAVAIRIAQGMGLHKEEANADQDPVVAEERRRIWCLLTHVDMLTARKSGLAPLISQHPAKYALNFSTLRDDYIGLASADPARDTYAPFIVAKLRFEACLYTKQILARQMDETPITRSEIKQLIEPVRVLEQKVEEAVIQLSSSDTINILPFAAPGIITNSPLLWSRINPDVHAYSRWAATTLRYLAKQAYCELYSLALSDISIWESFRAEALPHFQACVQLFVDLCTTHGYQPHQWLFPGFHQPIQSVAILLVDLYRDGDTTENLESRLLLEHLFSLFIDREDLSVRSHRKPLGSSTTQRPFASAWSNLEILRKRVWAKLGLDLNATGATAPNFRNHDATYLPMSSSPPIGIPNSRDLRYLWDQHQRLPTPAMVHNVQLTTSIGGSIHFQVPYFVSDSTSSQLNGSQINSLSTSAPRLPSVRATEWQNDQGYRLDSLNQEPAWMLDFDGQYSASQVNGSETSTSIMI